MNNTESKVLHALHLFDPVFIHEFLDIDLLICIDAVRAYKGLNDNIKDQISIRPDMTDKLNEASIKLEKKVVESLIYQSQTHGEPEKIAKKSLAFPDYPYSPSLSRERPHDLSRSQS